MANQTTYELDTKILDRLIDHLDGNVEDAIASTAFMVEGRAKIKAPVDTGALRASIYVSMKRGGNASDAMAAAKAKRPEAVIEPLPVPSDHHTAHVGPSVEYGQEVEMGSGTRAGQPYLRPALRETEKDLRDALSKAIQDK